MPRILGGYDPCLDDYAKSYYNRDDVQKALHVSTDSHHLKNWSICKYVFVVITKATSYSPLATI